MIPPLLSLVKYDNATLVSTTKEEERRGPNKLGKSSSKVMVPQKKGPVKMPTGSLCLGRGEAWVAAGGGIGCMILMVQFGVLIGQLDGLSSQGGGAGHGH